MITASGLDLDRVSELVAAGKSYPEIIEATGYTATRIARALKKAGLPRPKKTYSGRAPIDLDEDALRAAWSSDAPMPELVERFGVSDVTIRRNAQRLDLGGRPQRVATHAKTADTSHDAEVARLHALGMFSLDIAARLDINRQHVAGVLRRLKLDANKPAKREGAPSKAGAPRISAHEIDSRNAQVVRSTHAPCGAHFEGTLADSREWLHEHREQCDGTQHAPPDHAPPDVERLRAVELPRRGASGYEIFA